MSESHIAIVGAGVIGAAWAARFAMHGFDVRISDPSTSTSRVVDEVMSNARAAWADLDLPAGDEGRVTIVDSIADAVDGAMHVQESAPEDVALKTGILAAIAEACPAETVIASSTSGIRPSQLQTAIRHPERLVVGHPFNPVYLLPLVEVVGGEATSTEAIAAAMATYRSVSMHPLHVRVEIDAFIADRLLEAVWREALWLIKDGITTVEELDDIMRYGFGLRWAQMGLFQTYRIAGGEAGMKHFMDQFGPCLTWPWTKLMDVPEYNDELVDLIVTQSDEQTGDLTIRQLERIRDDNLVAMMDALSKQNRGKGWGAGALHKDYVKRLEKASKGGKASKTAEKAKAEKPKKKKKG